MKIHKVKQQTEEWHRLKYGKIGGTRAASLMLKNKNVGDSDLYYQILSEHTHSYEESEAFYNFRTENGNEFEPLAAEMARQVTGVEFGEIGLIEFDEFDCLSPDRITPDLKKALEIKCPSPKTYEYYLENNFKTPDPKYTWQLVKYFLIPHLKTLYFAIYSDKHEFQKIHIIALSRETELNIGTDKKPVFEKISKLIEMYKARKKELVSLVETRIAQYNSLIDF